MAFNQIADDEMNKGAGDKPALLMTRIEILTILTCAYN